MNRSASFLLLIVLLSSLGTAALADPGSGMLECYLKSRPKLNSKKSSLGLPSRESLDGVLGGYPPDMKNGWLEVRGESGKDFLREISYKLASAYEHALGKGVAKLEQSFQHLGQVSKRGKSPESIIAKLVRKDMAAIQNKKPVIATMEEARDAIGDGIGMRILLKSGPDGVIHPSTIQEFVDNLANDISKGLKVTEIINYRARGGEGLAYLSEAQINQLVRADGEFRRKYQNLIIAGRAIPESARKPLIVKTGIHADHKIGYSSFHMNIELNNGIKGEIQVKGRLMHEAAEVEHLLYDLRSKKIINEKLSSIPQIAEAIKAYKKLTPEQEDDLLKYLKGFYVEVRKKEAGLPHELPDLPEGIPRVLSMESLRPHLLHD